MYYVNTGTEIFFKCPWCFQESIAKHFYLGGHRMYVNFGGLCELTFLEPFYSILYKKAIYKHTPGIPLD